MADTDSDQDIDETVASLPEQTLRRIDEAFDKAISESQPEDSRPRKRRKIAQDAEPELAGGFLLDDDNDDDVQGGFMPADSGCGFLVEGNDNVERGVNTPPLSQPTHIPLSLIPRALQLLDLDPSDTQVLSVFEDAASSWESGNRRRRVTSNLSDEDEENEEPEQLVSRRDWRAVCAALMPTPPVPTGIDTTGSLSPLSSVEESDIDARSAPLEEESDSGSSAVLSAELDEDDSSEDEYIPETRGKGKGKGKGKASTRSRQQQGKTSPSKTQSMSKKPRKGKNTKTSSPDTTNPSDTKPLTVRQEQDTLAAFALFFLNTAKNSNPKASTRSTLADEELSKKRLTIRDVANAAASIKEKITAEEIIEMLTSFSSSSASEFGQTRKNNPSMSFQEFQQMMIAAKLA